MTFDREPFAGAQVQLRERYWDVRVETDDEGRFASELWAPADFAVLVSGAGIREPFGTMRRADLSDSEWTIDVPNRRVGGIVRDAATGKPLPNVRVVVEADDGNVRQSRLLTTDDRGSFSLPSAPIGAYEIRLQADGYHSPDAVRLRLVDNDRERMIDVALTPAPFVELTIIDAAGRFVADAIVMNERGRAHRTAADGKVSVPAGERLYILPREGSLSSGVFAEDSSWRVEPSAGTIRIVARSGNDTPVSNLGAALRMNGIAVPAAVLRQFATLHGGGMTTGPTGEVVLPRLPAGLYEVCLAPCAAWTRVPLTSGEARVDAMLR